MPETITLSDGTPLADFVTATKAAIAASQTSITALQTGLAATNTTMSANQTADAAALAGLQQAVKQVLGGTTLRDLLLDPMAAEPWCPGEGLTVSLKEEARV
jgi:hypothetical protein